jgi:glycosyltransferase involved in cell wall biosynthesis
LHVAPTPFFSDRGCHIRIRGLVLGLSAHGSKNIVCTYGLGEEVPNVTTVRCPRIPGYTKTAAGPSIFRFVADPLLVWTVARQIRTFRPHILHCHLHEGVLIGWLAKFLAFSPSLKIVFDMQGGLGSELVSYGHLRRQWLRRIIHLVERFIVKRADTYSCSSQVSVDLLTEEFSVAQSRIEHVPDGVDVPLDLPAPAFSNSEDLPVAIYTGGLSESKGLGMLKEIIKETADRGVDLRFVVVGYPVEEMQNYLSITGLGNCELVGRIAFSELATYLSDASICIEPKSAETSEASGKLLNYMASGRPTVCFDTPNNRRILNVCGFFAERATAASFVDQLELILEDPLRASQRALEARRIIQEQYDWRSSASLIMNRYCDLLE